MKKKVYLLVTGLLLLVLIILQAPTPTQSPPSNAYPWQVEITNSGHSRVFGVELASTTLQQVIQHFQQEPEVALFETGQQLTLEAYFKDVRLGGLSARYVLTLDSPAEQLTTMRERAYKRKVLESGSARYTLVATDVQQVLQWPVKSLSYIPYVNLQPELIEQRFGKPARIIQTSNTISHYLYPDMGLDLILDSDGKEVLQYVLPAEFDQLVKPLVPVKP